MTLVISDAAREDVATAIRSYDARPGRYGAAFRTEFEAAARAIAANPQLHPLVEDGIQGIEIREYFIARFDQRVIYVVERTSVLVVAVVHASRRPGAWHRQLPDET
jgi:plasmid stabilization system protein ParE